MLFVQDDSEVFLFSSAHWLLLSLSAVGEGRANGTWLSHLYENEVVNVISGGEFAEEEHRVNPHLNVVVELISEFAVIISAKWLT